MTLSRVFTDTFTGIAPPSVWGFLAAQLAAALLAVPVARALDPTSTTHQAHA